MDSPSSCVTFHNNNNNDDLPDCIRFGEQWVAASSPSRQLAAILWRYASSLFQQSSSIPEQDHLSSHQYKCSGTYGRRSINRCGTAIRILLLLPPSLDSTRLEREPAVTQVCAQTNHGITPHRWQVPSPLYLPSLPASLSPCFVFSSFRFLAKTDGDTFPCLSRVAQQLVEIPAADQHRVYAGLLAT